MADEPRSPSSAGPGMLAGIVVGAIASTMLYLATGSALAFVLLGLGAAVGLLAGAASDGRRTGSDRS